MLVIELHEGAVNFDILPPLRDEAIEQEVDASWNDAGIVLVLLDTAQEGDLLFFVVL
jgi:hypothetical protein